MQKSGSSRKSLIIGIIAAVVVLAAVLALVLTQCTGGQSESTTPSTTVATDEVPTYELYWNLDRELYDGKSEAGMSSRMPESDGYFHVRFFKDGEEVTVKVLDRKTINKIDVMTLMGLVFDENGIVVDVLDIKEMPLERVAWQFYVQSAGKTLIKANSSDTFGGMEVLLELDENTGVYDMTGKEGKVGAAVTPIELDRIMAVQNKAGEVTHVFIYERPNYMLTHEGECQHCGKTVTWYEWVREDKLPVKSGHYQLQNDIALSGQMSMTEQDQKICLDLNGKRVDGKNGARMYSMHNAGSHLAIMDTSEEQTGVMAAHGTANAQGMVVWVRYGQFHFYGGTLDGSDATNKHTGVSAYVAKNAYMYMYGGTIIGGTATWLKSDTGSYTRGYGGAMYVGGKFVMHDGEIRDGIAKSVTYKKNGTSTTTRGYGGNLFVGGTGEVELNGGIIKNGQAGSAGGNIYIDGSGVVTLNGTKIQGGKVYNKSKNGGSVYVTSKATLTIKSGSISGGTSYNAGGNLYANGTVIMSGGSISGGKIYNYTTKQLNEASTSSNFFLVNGTFKMYGGRIYGGVAVTDSSTTDNKSPTVSLSTNAVIKSDKEGATNLTLNASGTINCRVNKLSNKASIGINTSRGIFTSPTLADNLDNFFSDIPEAEVLYYNDCLALGKLGCVCGKEETHINGCDGQEHLWSPWTSATSAPKSEGNYYLLKDVTTTGQTVVTKGDTVRLDLNGHSVVYNVAPSSSDGYRVYRSPFESKLIITDTTDAPGFIRSDMPSEAEVQEYVQGKLESGDYDQAKADKIIAGQKAGNFGSVLWARGGDIVLHNGIIDGSNLNGSKSGMTVYIGANDAAEDGGVSRTGTFTMYNGTIKGATSTAAGGSLYGTSNSSITIHGGVIENGVSTNSQGGNIYTACTFYMDGGIVRNGKAEYSGGNISLEGAKVVATITGNAQILNGQAGNREASKDAGRGGNVRLATTGAQLTLSGNALISGGQVYRSGSNKAGYGGNLSINTGTTFIMTGGTVENGVSDYRSGNVDMCGIMIMEGGTITGGKAIYGGNIYLINGTDREITMTGGTIEKGHATTSGGNIYALAPVTISGGVVAEGKALADSGVPSTNNQGGNISTYSELVISGDAIIRDGVSGSYGGNISAAVDGSLIGDITISGNAQILGGKVDGQKIEKLDGGYGGNIRVLSGTKLVVRDNARIADGYANGGKYIDGAGGGGQGGNIYMTSADVQILGGVIENGTGTGGGGNIGIGSASSGTLLIQDAIIRNGTAGTSYGGNIRVRSGLKQLTITGKTQILGGTASAGGNMYIDGGAANVTIGGDALVTAGDVGTSGNGPCIYTGSKANLTITDNAVIDGTEGVGKRGGAIYCYNSDTVITIDGDAKLIGASSATTTHGKVAYLRGNVTIGGNVTMTAEGSTSYGTLYFYTGDLILKDNVQLDASAVTASNGSAIYSYQATANIYVQDSAVIRGGKSTGAGGTVYMDGAGKIDISGGTIYGAKAGGAGGAIRTTGDITMSGGTIYGGEATYGGAIYVYNGGSFTMTEGAISGGTATKSGGAVAIEANANPATFTMSGGYIQQGTAATSGGNLWLYGNKTNVKATATINNGMITYGVASTGSGGNVYMKNADLTMNGGLIDNGTNGIDYSGTNKPNGGSVFNGSNSVFTLNGGTLSGGKTINTGGNLVVYGEFVMNGGEIFGGCRINSDGTIGSTASNNANVYVVSAPMTMTGGHIDGRVALYGTATLTLSGNPSFTTDSEGVSELYLNGTTEAITINGTLTTEGRVAKVRAYQSSDRIFSTATVAENVKFFESFDEGEAVFLNGESKLEIGKAMCICGFKNGQHIGDCDGTLHNWSAWTDTEYLPTTSGYYYLTADLETAGNSSVTANNQKIFLDLNGHTIYSTSGGSRIFTTYKNSTYWTGTELTLVNSGDYGYIQGWNKGGDGKASVDNGSILWASSADTTFNLYNIILDASANTNSSGKYGGAISLAGTNCQLNVFNSTILGGKSQQGDAIAMSGKKNDQKIRLWGDVTITGTEGSAIYLGGTGNVIDVTDLTSLNDTCVYGEGTFTTGFSGDTVKWFTTTEDRIIEIRDGELHLARYYCICGATDGNHVEGLCDGTKYVWEPWTSTTKVPKTSGNYYLTDDVTLGATNTITTAQDIKIDLNGHSITSAKSRMYTTQYPTDRSVAISFVLTNTADDASTITITGNGDQGRVVWLSGYNKSLKVYNLTVDVSKATTAVSGVAFSMNTQDTSKSSYMGIFNTDLIGATAESDGCGSVISLTKGPGEIELQDVTISGGYGYKTDGTAGSNQYGAGIYLAIGSLTMKNVSITGAESGGLGGAIYVGATAKLSMSGQMIIEGKVGTADSAIYTNGGTIDVADLAAGSKIGISGKEGVISANTYEQTDPDLAYLYSDDAENYLILADGKLYLKGKSCICGASENGGDHVAGFCDGTEVAWQPLSGNRAPTESGNYFLTGDITFTKTANMASTDGNIVIDLNGYDMTMASQGTGAGRVYTTYAEAGSTSNVSIKFTNTSTNASTLAVEGGGDEGRIMWLTGSNKSLAMNNIEVDISTATINKDLRKDGLAVNVVGSGNTFAAYNCSVIGGTSTSNGNFLFLGNGNTATMKGCTVTDTNVIQGTKDGSPSGGNGGFAYIRGTLNLTNCTITGATAAKGAGAIYAYGSAEDKLAQLNITGCTFEACATSASYGGAIDLSKQANATIKNTTFKNCASKGRAGAIHISTDCELIMEGSTIEGCTDTARAGAIYNYQGIVTLNDCTIKNNSVTGTSGKGGAIYLFTTGLTLGGKNIITGNTVAGVENNIYLNGELITISATDPLESGSEIGVTGTDKISTNATYADKAYFTSDVDTLQIIHEGTTLKFVDAAEHWHCICGGAETGDPDHECKDVKFEEITSLAGGSTMTSGNYYMADSFAITKPSSGDHCMFLNGGVVVNLCLNGKTLSGTGGDRVFNMKANGESTLTITSCESGAVIDKASKYQGGLIVTNANAGILNLYGGVTLDGSDHKRLSTDSSASGIYGAAIHTKDTFNLYNATVTGSASADNATPGGTITVASTGVMNMYGGTIKDGMSKANTGNMYLSGTLNMMGGTITGGKFNGDATHRAANMYMSTTGVLNMTGGTIDGHVYAGLAGSTVKLSKDAKIVSSTRGLWVTPGKTNLFVGDLSEKAEIRVMLVTSSDSLTYGVLGAAAEGYTLTEQDVACFTSTTGSGAKRGNVVLNTDNTISVVAE